MSKSTKSTSSKSTATSTKAKAVKITHKVCGACDKKKPVEEFCHLKASPDGRMRECKACAYAYRKEWRERKAAEAAKAEKATKAAPAKAKGKATKASPELTKKLNEMIKVATPAKGKAKGSKKAA